MRLADLRQAVLPAGHRGDLPGEHEVEQLTERLTENVARQGKDVWEPHSGDRRRMPEEAAGLDRLRLLPARHPVEPEAPERRERRDALVGGGAAGHVEDDVDALAAVGLAQ